MALCLPPAPPLNPQSTISLHMPASDLTCFDPPSPSQPTPAPPAMSARSHHALSPPRTTRCRPIRASPEITRPLMHQPMSIIKKNKKNTVSLLRQPPPEQCSSAFPQQCLSADLTEINTDSCCHHQLYCPLRASPSLSDLSHLNRRPTPRMPLARVLPTSPHAHPS